MSESVAYELDRGVARITMNDGKVNVMSLAMLSDLDEALDRAANEADLVLLCSGLPGIFSAGFDLKVLAANDTQQSAAMVRAGAELALRLLSFPKPTLSVMAGHAYPMGTFLLLACDVRICAEGPYKMGLNEVAIGIAPPSFAIELARSRVHPAWLSRTVTLGEMFEPEDALIAGFVDAVVPGEQIEQRISEAIDALKNVHRPSHLVAKQRLRRATMAAMREAIDTELTVEA
ncbi:MAG: crotonase/enoyl-CoA hydratase family protein [Gammaproteobacteria bacterium]|nr:MAG: crotonase/enoyl-CoA hydratase family protein [Gammaproteobacteria bacterium]